MFPGERRGVIRQALAAGLVGAGSYAWNRASTAYSNAGKRARYLTYNAPNMPRGYNPRRIVIPASHRGYLRTGGGGAYQRFNQGENKSLTTSIGFAFDATNEVPLTGQLNLIPAGTGSEQRVGRTARVQSIELNLMLKFVPGASGTAAALVSLWVVQDMQCNGTAATPLDVVNDTNLAEALPNLDCKSRFKILRKFYVTMNPPAGATTAYNDMVKRVHWFHKFPGTGMPLRFSAETGALTEIATNNIFLLAGTGFAAEDDEVSCEGYSRIRFTDGH